MLKINLTCLVILCYFYLYFAISCHTERSEVSINLKREFAYLRRGFFILNLKCVLKLWIFRFVLTHSAQNDKRCGYFANAQYDNMNFFAAATPCNPLGRLLQRFKMTNFFIKSRFIA